MLKSTFVMGSLLLGLVIGATVITVAYLMPTQSSEVQYLEPATTTPEIDFSTSSSPSRLDGVAAPGPPPTGLDFVRTADFPEQGVKGKP